MIIAVDKNSYQVAKKDKNDNNVTDTAPTDTEEIG